jgi:D-3-phosphoglycerate dehydrogenase
LATPIFRVGITRDFLRPDGKLGFGDIGLSMLDRAPGVEWEFLPENVRELRPDQIRDYDALMVLAPEVTARTVEGTRRLAIVARFGVGYDSVDLDSCTKAGVAVTITPDGVRRPVAVAAMTFILALTHRLMVKDRITREGRWAEKLNYPGMGTTGRTLGVVGLGNIGQEVFRLAKPFEMRHIAADPYVPKTNASALSVELVPLDTLMRQSDYVVITCGLTPETRGMISRECLALMKPTSYLINVARGPIVDEHALITALRDGCIAGAGLDVFEQEPPVPHNPLFLMENVILAPHAICWTDECFLNNGKSACGSILDVAAGRAPVNIVNKQVAISPLFLDKLKRNAAAGRA